MTKTRKVELLYKIAKGQNPSMSKEEAHELRNYRVESGDGGTKSSITNYINAVDSGQRPGYYYDYCRNTLQGDKRYKKNSNSAMKAQNREFSISSVFIGWLPWGMCIYWTMGVSAEQAAIIGIIISFILSKVARNKSFALNTIFPIIIAVIAAK